MNPKEIERILNELDETYDLTKPEEFRCTEAIKLGFKQGIKRAEQLGIDSLKFVELEVKKQPTDRGIQHLKSQIISYIIPIAEKELKQKLSAELAEEKEIRW